MFGHPSHFSYQQYISVTVSARALKVGELTGAEENCIIFVRVMSLFNFGIL